MQVPMDVPRTRRPVPPCNALTLAILPGDCVSAGLGPRGGGAVDRDACTKPSDGANGAGGTAGRRDARGLRRGSAEAPAVPFRRPYVKYRHNLRGGVAGGSPVMAGPSCDAATPRVTVSAC